MNIELIDGPAVISEMEKQVALLIERGLTPELIYIGSYAYFLLKDHFNNVIDTKVNRFFPLQSFTVSGYEMTVVEIPRKDRGGLIEAKNYIVKIYGN